MGGWVDQWVSSCQIIRNRVNCHLIEIIEFRLKIYDFVGGWVSGLLCGSVGGVMSNH